MTATPSAIPHGRAPAPPEVQEAVRRLIAREGTARAARAVGLSISGVLSIAAGGRCNAGTVAQAKAAINAAAQ
jgi:hypothetical protein